MSCMYSVSAKHYAGACVARHHSEYVEEQPNAVTIIEIGSSVLQIGQRITQMAKSGQMATEVGHWTDQMPHNDGQYVN
jgi:hypothetical protein